MKILFFNYEYPPLGGGAANATAYLLKEYSKTPDLYIDLITSSIDSQYHLEKIEERISIHRLPIGKNKNKLHYQSQKEILKYAFRAYFFSLKLAKKERYNLSHAFFTVPCGFISLLLKWQFKIPYIVSLRGSDVPGYNERFTWFYKLIKPLVRLIWSNASSAVANSEGLKKLALDTNPHQEISVIYNGIDINEFKPAPEKKPADKFIITTGASRITARKGLKYLIWTLSALVSKYPQLYLKAMGDGDERENLMALVKKLNLEKNVEFLGRIPREKTASYYQEAGLFVLPSLNEGMSNAMLEALASGLPLVATDTGGTKELLDDGRNGYIVKMKNSADLTDKIETLMKDEELRKKMGDASRKKAEDFSWGKVANQYFEIYRKIA